MIKRYFIRRKLNKKIKAAQKEIKKLENKETFNIFMLLLFWWIILPFSGLFNRISKEEQNEIYRWVRYIKRVENIKLRYQ